MAFPAPFTVEHTFSDGLLTDMPATQTPRTVLTGGQNMHLLASGEQGEQQILQADHGNAYKCGLPEDWVCVGSGGFNDVEYFLFAEISNGVATGRGQIGSFPSPEPAQSGDPNDPSPDQGVLLERYRPLHNFQPYLNNVPSDPTLFPFEADEFNFSLERPVQVEIQPDYDGTVNIIFNEPHGDVNPPRLINSRFVVLPGNRYKIIDRTGQRDANLYSPASFASSLRLFQRSRSLVKCEFLELLDGGQVLGGMWTYYFAYVNQDTQATDVVAWSPSIPVFDGNHAGIIRGTQRTTTRRVSMLVSGLDTDYQFLRVYAVRRFGEGASEAVDVVQLVPDYRLTSTDGTLRFSHTGYEQSVAYTQDLLSLRTSELETFGAMAQVDNMLAFIGGRQAIYDADSLRDFAESVSLHTAAAHLHTPGLTDDGTTHGLGRDDPFIAQDFNITDADGRLGGYLNPWNVAYRLGYPTGEALAFGAVFRLASGVDSAVFPMRGHDHLMSEQAYLGANAVLDARGWSVTGENLDGVFRFPQLASAGYPGESTLTSGRVTILGVSFEIPQIPAAVRQAAVGIYFVRLKRNPDRLAQGYGVTTVTSVVSARDDQYFDHYHDQLDFIKRPNAGRQDPNLKVLPAVAGILESNVSHIGTADPEYHAMPFEFAAVQDNDRYQLNPYRLAFYSPDTVADPTRIRSQLQGRQLRMSGQGYVEARAGLFTLHPNEDGRGTFKLWKTTHHSIIYTDARRTRSYWTEGGSAGANDGGFGGQEKRLMGKHTNDDVEYLCQGNWDDYVGLLSATNLDGDRAVSTAWTRIGNNSTGFGGGGTGRTLGFNVQSFLNQPRSVALLLNLYPEHASDDAVAAQTQGARPRDVLRDLYAIDAEGWFPISPVMSLDELEAGLDHQRRFTCFGGDTYKGVSYRRISINLRADQGTDNIEWTKVIIGQALSMVCESDVNPYAGREKEVQARPGEGAPRSWWAAVWEDSGRDPRVATSDSYKALESAGYNAGFANASGATRQLTLPRNVPFRALTFPNQIAVTGTHVPGGFQNGYRRYVPGSAQTYNRELGSALSLRAQGRTLVVGFENGIAMVAVNERTQAGADSGGPTFLEVRQILNPFSTVLSRQVGVLSQFATAATDEAVFGLDYSGAWRVQSGAFTRLSTLRVDKLLLPHLRILGNESTLSLLKRQVKLSLDLGRGDVIFSLFNNAWARPALPWQGPADPLATSAAVSFPIDEPLTDPYSNPPHAGLLYNWSEKTCLQLVYSYRLDKWLPPTSYRAQHHFSQNQQLYALPLPEADGSGRFGIFRFGGNIGYYFDRLHPTKLEVTVIMGQGQEGKFRQFLLNNLVVVSNELLPVTVEYQPLSRLLTVQPVVGPAPGNIRFRNAEYREDRTLLTVPSDLLKRRQRARAVRVLFTWEPRLSPLRIDAILADLAESLA